MENVVNLEQLNYRDQLIKEYIDSKIQPSPEPTPAAGSGEVYYDFALWQKSFAGHGSNAIAFFGQDGSARITDLRFSKNQKYFLLQVGNVQKSHTVEDVGVCYDAKLYAESVLQGLDTRPDDYRVFIYIPVTNGIYNQMGGKDDHILGYKGCCPFWVWYTQFCADNPEYLLKYRFKGDQEWSPMYFNVLNTQRVFCFYKTVSQWREIFEGREYIEIEICDPCPPESVRDNKTRYRFMKDPKVVRFAGFGRGRTGLFKTLRDTFDLRKNTFSRPSYPLYDKRHLYNLHSGPHEKTWHLDPIKEEEVKVKRHYLNLFLQRTDNYNNSVVIRSSRRVFRTVKSYGDTSVQKGYGDLKTTLYSQSLLPSKTIFDNSRSHDHNESEHEPTYPGPSTSPIHSQNRYDRIDRLANHILGDEWESPTFLMKVCYRIDNKFAMVEQGRYKKIYRPYVGPRNNTGLVNEYFFEDNWDLSKVQDIDPNITNRYNYANTRDKLLTSSRKRRVFYTNRPFFSMAGSAIHKNRIIYDLIKGEVVPTRYVDMLCFFSKKRWRGGEGNMRITIFVGDIRSKTKRSLRKPAYQNNDGVWVGGCNMNYKKVFLSSKLQEYILKYSGPKQKLISIKRGRIVDPREIKEQF